MPESFLQVHQHDHDNNPQRHFSGALFFKINARNSALHINGQEAIKLLPVAFIALYLRFSIFLRSGVMRVRHTLKPNSSKAIKALSSLGCAVFLSQ